MGQKKNRYVVIYLGRNDSYTSVNQHIKEFRSKPAAYEYAKSRGYGHCVAKINNFDKEADNGHTS